MSEEAGAVVCRPLSGRQSGETESVMVVVTGVTGVTGVSLAPQQRPHHVETGRGPAHSLPASHRGRHPEVWRQWDSAGRGGAGPLSDVQLSSDGGLPLQHQVVSGRPGILQIYPRRFVENHALLPAHCLPRLPALHALPAVRAGGGRPEQPHPHHPQQHQPRHQRAVQVRGERGPPQVPDRRECDGATSSW